MYIEHYLILGGECEATEYCASVHDYYYNYKTDKVYLKKGLKHRVISPFNFSILETLINYSIDKTPTAYELPDHIFQVKITRKSRKWAKRSKSYLYYKQNQLMNLQLGKSLIWPEPFNIPFPHDEEHDKYIAHLKKISEM